MGTSNKENEKISLHPEVQKYLEEQKNQTRQEILESLKKPMEYMEKFMEKYQKLEIKNKELEERNLCKVCMEAEICFVFLPCGHLCTCENCAVNGNLKDCPICRVKIEKRNKTFIS